jgi:hypothetical protein
MPITPWRMKGPSFNNCNCDYGCPCQFNALPTHRQCEAIAAMHIDSGNFGPLKLDGLNWVAVFHWPGAVHQGNGTCQAIIDERANPAQRDALLQILSGKASEPGSTYIQVFSTTVTKAHEPLFKPIEFTIDVPKRTATLRVPGLIEGSAEPIRNPVTGAESRAQICLPDGFEYTIAEVASGTTKSTAAVKLDLKKTHSHLGMYDLTEKGVVRP